MSEQKKPTIILKIEEVQFALGPYLLCQVQVEGDPDGQIPSGVVDFRRGGHVLGNATLDGEGKAALKYSGFPAGKNNILCGYSGDSNYLPVECDPVPYFPSKATKTPTIQQLPPGFSQGPIGNATPVLIHQDKREVLFEVNLSAYAIPTPLASGRTNLDNLTATRRINIAGVGSGMKHGDRFTLVGEEAKTVYRGYKEFLTIISGGFNEG